MEFNPLLHGIWITKMISKGKILYIGGFDLPDNNAAANRVVSNSKLLQEMGYKVTLVGISQANGSDHLGYIEGTELQYQSLTYPITFFDWFMYLTSIRTTVRQINMIKPDFIICYNYPAVALLRLMNYCKKNHIRIIADCTEWYEGEGNIGRKYIKEFDTYLRMKIAHPKLDGIIVISNYLRSYYRNRLKTVLLPPLVDVNDLKWGYSVSEVNEEQIKIIYAGSPGNGRKDRLDDVVRLMLRCKELKCRRFILEIIGPDKEQFLKVFKVDDVVIRLGDWIKIIGRMPHNAVIEKMRSADYFIFLRDDSRLTRAGFPTKFVESISCGLPVITNCNSDIESYISNGLNGIVLPNEQEKAAHTLCELFSQSTDIVSICKSNAKMNNPFDYHKYYTPLEEFMASLDID